MTGQRIMFDLRMEMYGHLQRLDLRYYDRNPVGRLMTRVTTDVDVLNELFTSGVVSRCSATCSRSSASWSCCCGWTGGWRWSRSRCCRSSSLVTQWFRRNVRESYRDVRGWIARINAFLQENITGMSTVQLFRREALQLRALRRDRPRAPRRQHRVDLLLRGVLSGDRARERARGGADHLVRRRAGCCAGTLTLGALVAFLQYSQRFFRPISDMSEKFNILQAAMASSERIFELLDTPVAIQSPAPRRSRPRRSCTARHASARHRGSSSVLVRVQTARRAWVLRDVSFEVEPGERVGIVGATGSGKTTLINLLLRFYDVQRGRITIDGVDIRELDLAELRGLFGLVLQDVHLFSGTIADNIRLGQQLDRRRRGAARGATRCTPTGSSSGCRAATTRRSPSAARRCRSGRSSCCRSRARWRSIRAS